MNKEINEIIERWKKANPIVCHGLGIHTHDGELPLLTKEFLHNRISELEKDIKTVISKFSNDKIHNFEMGLIQTKLETELFQLSENKDFTKTPTSWLFPLALVETSYMARNFAPFDDRLRLVIKMEKQIPSYLKLMDETLDDELARPKINMALSFLKGFINYYKDKLISFITKSDNESLILEWSEVNIKAVDAMEMLRDKLKNYYLPRSHNDFALGKEKFSRLLKYTEGVDTPLETLLEIGENDLKINYQNMLKVCEKNGGLETFLAEVKADSPKPENIIKEIKQALIRTKKFVVSKDLLDLPSDEMCDVILTPEFARSFAFAAMSTPGPFEVEEANESYYWVSPPDPTWSEERTKEYMKLFNKAFLEIVTVHEAFPGHYVQLLFNKKSNSTLAKMFARSITLIEGWGLYSEQMMYDEGYEPFDRDRLKVGQLIGALVRNVRFVCAIKMHTQGMTVKEAKQMFMEKAFLSEPTAEIEANRGTVNPMYLNYTLGKLMILKLREDYKKERGDKFSLKEFHNKLLSYASPQITVLRKIILENDDGYFL